MCGIVGSYHSDFDVAAGVVALRHRGPDGEGVDAHCGFVHGHTRLAIQDLSAASAQPFRYRDGMLSYNGELWNAADVREDLAALGHRFETSGDTEVVAAACSEWGAAALARLDGMLAFAWSSPADSFVVRDRYGKLPLYFTRTRDGGFAWASERKGLGRYAGTAAALEAGTLLRPATGERRRWWATRAAREPDVDVVEAQLLRGVERRMVSDAPLCTLLSGGLDSSLITAMAARIRPDIVAYTISCVDDSEDVAAAIEVARHCGVEHRVVRVPLPDEDEVREAVRTVEVVSKTAVETTIICKRLAERISADGFKVALSGETADELFGGYGTLCRKASSDDAWRSWRMAFLRAMAGKDYHRVNKSFMAHGVEVRMPFCEDALVSNVLGMSRRQCPTSKRLLVSIAERYIPREVAHRPKAVFHGPSGVKGHCEAMFASPIRVYGQMAREIFGTIPHG